MEKGDIFSISYPSSGDVTEDLEYTKPARRRFSMAFSLTISGRRMKRRLAGMPATDISLMSGGGIAREK